MKETQADAKEPEAHSTVDEHAGEKGGEGKPASQASRKGKRSAREMSATKPASQGAASRKSSAKGKTTGGRSSKKRRSESVE